MHPIHIHQIYYDAQTKASLDPGFIPLDNMSNKRPDWYEFWVMREYLNAHSLDENAWYGFLSPKFGMKSGLASNQLKHLITQANPRCEVVLINQGFDQIAYFINPFEQGEHWHPGISALSQNILDKLGYPVRIESLVTHSYNFTFSNFIVAKLRYWRAWLEMADRLFNYIEHGSDDIATMARAETTYGSASRFAPIKTFIQERLPCVLNALQKFEFMSIENSVSFPIFDRVFAEDKYTRALLQSCNILKARYCESRDDQYLKAFYATRRLIGIKPAPK